MHWVVDNVPDQSLMNTAGWRFIIPQLYRKYPNDDLNLNLSVTSPPTIKIEKRQIKAKIPLDVVIDVLEGEEVIPVLCISVVSLLKPLFYKFHFLSLCEIRNP